MLSIELDKQTGTWSVILINLSGDCQKIFTGSQVECREHRRKILTGKVKV